MVQNVVTLDSLLASLEDNGLAKQASEAPQATTATSVGKELETILNKQANEANLVNAQQKGQAIADSVVALLKQASEGGNRVITETAAHVAQSSAGLAETPREGNTITNTLQGLVANGIANGAVRADALDEHLDNGGDEGHNGNIEQHSSDGHDLHATSEGSEMDDEVEKTAALIELVDNGIDFNTAVALIKQAEEEIEFEEFEQVKQAAVAGLLDEGMDIESAIQLVKIAMDLDEDMVKEAAGMFDFKQRELEAGDLKSRQTYNKTMTGIELENAKRERTGARRKEYDKGYQKSVGESEKAYGKTVDEKGAKKAGKYKAPAYKPNAKPGMAARAGDALEDMYIKGKGVGTRALEATKHYGRIYGPAAAVGAAGVAAVGAGGYALTHREKRAAAVSYLLNQGYDVQTALDMVEGE